MVQVVSCFSQNPAVKNSSEGFLKRSRRSEATKDKAAPNSQKIQGRET